MVTWAAVLAELQSNSALLNADKARANQPGVVALLNDHVAPVNFMIGNFPDFKIPAAKTGN